LESFFILQKEKGGDKNLLTEQSVFMLTLKQWGIISLGD